MTKMERKACLVERSFDERVPVPFGYSMEWHPRMRVPQALSAEDGTADTIVAPPCHFVAGICRETGLA